MKRTITIFCSKEVPVKHLLNTQDYEIFQSREDENVFTFDEKVVTHDNSVEK